MSWVPDNMWLTYLVINSPAGQLTGDLSINEPGVQPLIVMHKSSNSRCGRGGRSWPSPRSLLSSWWPRRDGVDLQPPRDLG